ncbi:MAG: indole-3-glycerol phosphate synthase TrpC [Clostridiales bacterium]|jgi:indole-3-glycerol phosphate synthase|nr:indole-3-glycerol phosphate synthase TrpC [Clostridiales bacterium]
MILDEIAATARKRVEAARNILPPDELREKINFINLKISDTLFFEKALSREGVSLICELKKASPSRGIIIENFDYQAFAKIYEKARVDAISVLTEPYYFMGSNEILTQTAAAVNLPLLRKDFVVDEYQIYEAKLIGASAVLLICALLEGEKPETLEKYLSIAHEIGLSALVEAHNEGEIKMALSAGAKIIGVNNRNLKDFSVDITNSAKLRELVPPGVLFVSESGIQSPDDVRGLKKNGVDAVLIGEAVMRADNKEKFLSELRQAANCD